jgi:ribonuclease-3
MLTSVAEEIGFNDFLLLSKGEAKEGGKARAYILANTFEALLGAIYLDLGYSVADEFIKKYLMVKLADVIKTGAFKDSKSKFQESSQDKTGITPSYKVMKETGPDHNKNFVVGVFLGEEKIAEGEGSSKQEAEEAAAKAGLQKKNWNSNI